MFPLNKPFLGIQGSPIDGYGVFPHLRDACESVFSSKSRVVWSAPKAPKFCLVSGVQFGTSNVNFTWKIMMDDEWWWMVTMAYRWLMWKRNYSWSCNMGKTMPWKSLMTGNGKFITPIKIVMTGGWFIKRIIKCPMSHYQVVRLPGVGGKRYHHLQSGGILPVSWDIIPTTMVFLDVWPSKSFNPSREKPSVTIHLPSLTIIKPSLNHH